MRSQESQRTGSVISFQLETPVVLIIFNRPNVTRIVFEAIRAARPKELFVIADGPRDGKNGELEKCTEARAIVERVDWECAVHLDYSESNQGCKGRIVSGLNVVFEKVEKAIILEDDCLPDGTFFQFCQELLSEYEDSLEVGCIGGSSVSNRDDSDSDYYFSRIPRIWGWATWRRVWSQYDASIDAWPEMKKTGIVESNSFSAASRKHWSLAFDEVYGQKLDTWDYQLVFSLWAHNQLSITPYSNLVSNLGFGVEATHTFNSLSSVANMETKPVVFPLRHPDEIKCDELQDRQSEVILHKRGFGQSILKLVSSLLSYLRLGKMGTAVFAIVTKFISQLK